MKPYDHQVTIAKQAINIIKEHMIVYLAMEERTGKTLTSILVCEGINVQNILVITKKKAISGWEDTLKAYTSKTKNYTVINYESVHHIDPKKQFDLIIIDEAHANLSAYPKVGERWKVVAKLTKKKPIIFLSATPSAQTYAQLFHQLALSTWSPWNNYKNFYEWFKVFGIPEYTYGAGGRQIIKYNNVKTTEVFNTVEHLFISYTRQDLGFKHEPNDVIHMVKLGANATKHYNDLNKNNMLYLETEYIADTPMKLLMGLHQIEGGTLKLSETETIDLGNTEKIQYIQDTFGDTEDLVIFYHYKGEEHKLKKHFRFATILQATSFAEGVDLSMYKTLVIYSMDFSTARYSQRRARQANMKRNEPIDVHYILVEKAISAQVYETVAINKSNFIDKYFNRDIL